MLKKEWLSIWKDKKYFLSLIVMFVMPVLYCGLLLYAFWDPYGQLEELPVAIVNEDQGTVYEDKTLTLGDDLVDNLLESSNFKYIPVTAEEAEEMLRKGEAYISLAIPENFSKHSTTMLDANPEKLIIQYRVNEAVNYLTSKIGDSAINQIRAEVNEEVSKTYAEQLFKAITQLGDGFGDAADGAVKLKDGVFDLKSGSEELKDYLHQLASSTVTLKDGTGELAQGVIAAKDGAQKLVEGTEQLGSASEQLAAGASQLQAGANSLGSGLTGYTSAVSEIEKNNGQLLEAQQTFQSKLEEAASGGEQLTAGASSVANGTAQLSEGIAALHSNLEGLLAALPQEQQQALQASLTQLEESSKQIAAGAASVNQGASDLVGGVSQLAAGHAAILDNSQKLAAGLAQLNGSSDQLMTGSTQLEEGITTIASKLNEFNTGMNSVVSGTQSLRDGLVSLDTGSQKLATGTNTLSEKSQELAEGTVSLVEGTEQLADGATELETALKDAHEEAKIDITDHNYEMVASPVNVDKDIQNKVDNYGTGLAPYFISLGLFVGALLITNVYNFVTPAVQPTSVRRWFISKSIVPFVIWIFQSILLTLVLLYGLKLNVTNIPLFVLLMAVTSFSFIAIIQLIVVLFNDVGKLIGLIFLIVQLSSSAGTFPVELLPKVFQGLYDYMPMSYAVEALRHIISSTDYSVVYRSINILAVIGVVCVVLSYMYFKILYRLRYAVKKEAAPVV